MSHYLVSAIRWGTYLALLTPLVVSRSTIFPFVLGKAVAFRVLVEVLFLLWIALILIEPARRPRRSWLACSVLAYVASALFSTVFSLNPVRAFWSNAERMEGLFGLLHFAAFFFIIATTFRGETQTWLRFLRFSVGASLLMSLAAIIQWLQLPSGIGGPWDAGTLGHPSFLSVYLVFHTAFALFLAVKAESRVARWLWAGVVPFEAFVVFLTGARGMFVGLAGALLFFACAALVLRPLHRMRPYALGLLVLLLISVSGLYLFRQSPFVLGARPLARAASVFTFRQESSVRTRLLNWEVAIRAFREHPFLGWGPEMSYAAFYRHVDPAIMSIEEAHFDRPHNKVLEVLLVSGLFGLLTYLAVFAALGRRIYRQGADDSPLNSPTARLIVSALLVAYFIQNLFIFDHHASSLMFFLTAGLLEAVQASKWRRAEDTEPSLLPLKGLPGALVVLCVALAMGYGIFVNWRHYTAARLMHQARDAPTLDQSVLALDRATREAPPFLMEIGIRFGEVVHGAERTTSPASLRKALDKGSAWVGTALAQDPLDLRGYDLLTLLLLKKANLTGETRHLDAAEEILRAALRVAPRFPSLNHNLGSVALARGDYGQAIRYGEEAIRRSPGFRRSWWFLGVVYSSRGDDGKAVSAFDRAFELGYDRHWNSIDALEGLSALYHRVERHREAAAFLSRLLKLDPKNPRHYRTLAAVYKERSDYRRARDTTEKLLSILPTLTLPQAEKAALERSAREFLFSLKKQ